MSSVQWLVFLTNPNLYTLNNRAMKTPTRM